MWLHREFPLQRALSPARSLGSDPLLHIRTGFLYFLSQGHRTSVVLRNEREGGWHFYLWEVDSNVFKWRELREPEIEFLIFYNQLSKHSPFENDLLQFQWELVSVACVYVYSGSSLPQRMEFVHVQQKLGKLRADLQCPPLHPCSSFSVDSDDGDPHLQGTLPSSMLWLTLPPTWITHHFFSL